jgi:hypothetical protein
VATSVNVPRVGAGDVHAVSEGRHLLAQRPYPLVHTAQGPGGTEADMCSWSDGLILQGEVWQERRHFSPAECVPVDKALHQAHETRDLHGLQIYLRTHDS